MAEPCATSHDDSVEASAVEDLLKADEKQAAAAKQAEEEAAAVEAMTCMEYLTAYKELHPRDMHRFLRFQVVRTPFTDTKTYKSLAADPGATQEDIDAAAEEHEEHLDRRTRFRDWVCSEYEAKGYVHVSDEYIAWRAAIEEFSRKLIEREFPDDSDSDEDDEDDEEDVTAH